jgi:16S rRNA (uracil1498-N3)-methyltransferase
VNLFFQPRIPEGILTLDEEESRHCIKVLRTTSGESISITDGKGFFYEALITKADPRVCEFQIINKIAAIPKSFSIHIAISPTKNAERLEWFIEKAVEIGIDKITLLECKHTERAFQKKDRLEKVAISAMKQSLKAQIPDITPLTKFNACLETARETEKYIAFVDHLNPNQLKSIASSDKSYIVLIGPEGDFSPEELKMAIDLGFKKVSLGQSRLRTETAGLVACHTLNLVNS